MLIELENLAHGTTAEGDPRPSKMIFVNPQAVDSISPLPADNHKRERCSITLRCRDEDGSHEYVIAGTAADLAKFINQSCGMFQGFVPSQGEPI